MKQTILVVEDDQAILTGLIDLLESEGFTVLKAVDGNQALRLYEREHPDLILLDVMIPDISGYDVCRRIRKADSLTPVLMLTAKGQEIDKVVGLELGADDYIVKPFGIRELLARIRAAFRRRNVNEGVPDLSEITFGSVWIDPKTLEGKRGATTFPVSTREVELLRLFMAHDGEVVHRFEILDKVWGMKYGGTTRTLDQHIAKLRRKIEDDPSSPRYIRTVHGVGYRFVSRSENTAE
jgi:DNA-binding response OmpR family regulator